jgi:general secretion pathway protein F
MPAPALPALEQHPREFSDIFCAVIGAGESSGSLGPVLRTWPTTWRRQALQSKLIGASLYPAIVTLVAIVIVIFLVSYVVPQVAGVFAGTKRALPFLTVVMLGISDFVRSWSGWPCCCWLPWVFGWRSGTRRFASASMPSGCICRS